MGEHPFRQRHPHPVPAHVPFQGTVFLIKGVDAEAVAEEVEGEEVVAIRTASGPLFKGIVAVARRQAPEVHVRPQRKFEPSRLERVILHLPRGVVVVNVEAVHDGPGRHHQFMLRMEDVGGVVPFVADDGKINVRRLQDKFLQAPFIGPGIRRQPAETAYEDQYCK